MGEYRSAGGGGAAQALPGPPAPAQPTLDEMGIGTTGEAKYKGATGSGGGDRRRALPRRAQVREAIPAARLGSMASTLTGCRAIWLFEPPSAHWRRAPRRPRRRRSPAIAAGEGLVVSSARGDHLLTIAEAGCSPHRRRICADIALSAASRRPKTQSSPRDEPKTRPALPGYAAGQRPAPRRSAPRCRAQSRRHAGKGDEARGKAHSDRHRALAEGIPRRGRERCPYLGRSLQRQALGGILADAGRTSPTARIDEGKVPRAKAHSVTP